ncbi:DUF2974 domain-containing protein [Paenibacillus nanensis]|uniref:DUF2974 domain-containing protein n=1 Tax=Paenibacillus nanensis TaxID=393251 RepID=A0A3A1UQN0_9BACL|nr:Mbeg1-like protein [Paenibacillus nanensis]RIX50808.1 DUF2974 domain-containing protein [Paenibacillus nanensis]
MQQIDEVELQKLSQLVYLDVLKPDGSNTNLSRIYKETNSITIGQLIDYYSSDPAGIRQLEERFIKELDGKPEIDYWKGLLSELSQNEEMRQWKISDVKPNTETGFAAMTIEPVSSDSSQSSSGNTKIVVFRGSEPMEDLQYWNDWSNNLRTMYMLESPQQAEAKKYMEDLIRKYPELEELYTTGHSLGGNLALYAGFTLPEEVLSKLVTTTTFNAPGFNTALLNKHQHAIDYLNAQGKLREFRNNGDIVPALFHNPSSGIYLASDFDKTDYMGSHSLFATSMNATGTGFVLNHKQSFDLIPLSVKLLTVELESMPYELKEKLVEEIDRTMTEGFDWKRTLSVAFEVGPELIKELKEELRIAVTSFIIDQIRYRLIPWIKDVLTKVKEGLINGVKSFAAVSFNLMEAWINNKIERSMLWSKWKDELQSAISSFFDKMEKNFNRLVDRVVKWAEDEVSYWMEEGKRAVTGIATIVKETTDAIGEKAKEIASSIKKFRDQKMNELKAAAYKAVTLVSIGIGKVKKGVKIVAKMRELESLEHSLKKKERALHDILASAIKRATHSAEQADRSYGESGVQYRVRRVMNLCDKISKERQKIESQIQELAEGVRDANAAYNTLESTLKRTLMRAVGLRF